MACSTGCPTQDHASYGECMREKGVRPSALDVEMQHKQKKADKNLDAYAQARRYGVQPKSTRPHDVEAAVRISDQTGEAFKA